MGDRLWNAIARVPDGAGIVFRHYSLPPVERALLAHHIAETVRPPTVTLAIAADVELAKQVGADLVHNPNSITDLPFSRSVHNVEEAKAARLAGAALVFVSPVFATRSHPERPPLRREQAARIARAAAVPAIALGGVNAESFPPLERAGFYGWAGIAAWM
jgi:thiamine-phosphate pyrophosphorylase